MSVLAPEIKETLELPPKAHTVWVGEEDRVASFHEVENYQKRTFTCRDHFMGFLHTLQQRGFRFQ